MKSASTQTLGILSGGQYLKAELFEFTLTSGNSYYFTSFQTALSAAVYPSSTVIRYGSGLVIKRDTITSKVGIEAGSCKLTISPQLDYPAGPVMIEGYPFLEACTLGMFDNAICLISKLYMNYPEVGQPLDTSPGAVAYFKGTCGALTVDRQTAEITVDDFLAMLSVQMPRNTYMPACAHTFLDAGCDPSGSVRAALTLTGNVNSVTDAAHFGISITSKPNNYFNQGVIKFTGGGNMGFSGSIASYTASGGAVVLRLPMPEVPHVGDPFTIIPGCDKQQATCIGYGNIAHNKGLYFIPMPETMEDGGIDQPPTQNPGSQAGQIIGSNPGGGFFPPGRYKT